MVLVKDNIVERNFLEWAVLPIKRYVKFQGRARRKELWFFYLLILIAYITFAIIDITLGLGGSSESYVIKEGGAYAARASLKGGTLTTFFLLAMIVPALAVTSRRLHDSDRSAWWMLIVLVPFLGAIVLIVFCIIEGSRGSNRFGPDPLEAEEPMANA